MSKTSKKISQQDLRKIAKQIRPMTSLKRAASKEVSADEAKRLKADYLQLLSRKRRLEEEKLIKKMSKTQPKDHQKQVRSILKSSRASLVTSYGDDSSDDDVSEARKDEKMVTSSTVKVEKKKMTSSALPKGFFDDEDVEAKMNNEETKEEKMNREMKIFQKEIRKEEESSGIILDEDHDDENRRRQLAEIEEQIEFYKKIIELQSKVETKMNTSKTKQSVVDESDEDDDEEDDEDVDDWRRKSAF